MLCWKPPVTVLLYFCSENLDVHSRLCPRRLASVAVWSVSVWRQKLFGVGHAIEEEARRTPGVRHSCFARRRRRACVGAKKLIRKSSTDTETTALWCHKFPGRLFGNLRPSSVPRARGSPVVAGDLSDAQMDRKSARFCGGELHLR
jgi:hypothetical protein